MIERKAEERGEQSEGGMGYFILTEWSLPAVADACRRGREGDPGTLPFAHEEKNGKKKNTDLHASWCRGERLLASF